jgi:hypothetical protein
MTSNEEVQIQFEFDIKGRIDLLYMRRRRRRR